MELTKEQWIRKCAYRYMMRADVPEKGAFELATACWEAALEFDETDCDPEEAADEDMACWDHDGDE